MSTIIIRNIGPIKDVSIDLNKINIIMGPQSSGKSTIAKIISFCSWIEKDVTTNQSLQSYQNKDYFRNKLESFHKMKDYFRKNTEIIYKSEVLELVYNNSLFKINWIDQDSYKRSKISYIPAERNMVILPEMEKVELYSNSFRSFLFDWFDARKNYTKNDATKILNFDVNYYFDEKTRENHIESTNNGGKYDILLSDSSSGLQSIVPLFITFEYLTNWIYNNEQNLSFEAKDKREKADLKLIKELIFKPIFKDKYDEESDVKLLFEEVLSLIDNGDNDAKSCKTIYDIKKKSLFTTHYTQFIIEEPEQNLFPNTQKDLVYYLFRKCNNIERNHQLTITTHSPYILYAVNNCMMGYLVKEKMPKEQQGKIENSQSWIDPKLISIWEIEDGKLNNIQNKDGLIGKNYFDASIKRIMDDYYTMLNYYGDEE
jgi:hypothetical protein